MTKQTLSESQILQRLTDYAPTVLHRTGRQAAVLVAFVMQPELSILLTVRSANLKSHPGDVSFPGGMVEQYDDDLIATALRETQEEVGIPTANFRVVGSLSTALSKDGIPVHPIVAITSELGDLILCPEEISEAFMVPWHFFQTTMPEFTPVMRHGIHFEVPHYYFEGRHIWGLTAMILLELINVLDNTHWPLPQSLLAEHSRLIDR